MSETIALLRWSFTRNKALLAVLLAIVCLGEAIALISVSAFPDLDPGKAAIPALLLSLLPAAMGGLGLFDCGHDKDLMSPESGCSDWLLRMPIASWKIAIVPVVLKTIWISGIWILFVVTASHLGMDEVVPWLAPSLCFSAGLIWVLFIAWKPVRNGWSRIGLLAIATSVVYLLFAAVIVSSQPAYIQWKPLATAASIAVYAMGAWLTIRAVKVARTSCLGIVPELGRGVEKSEQGDCRRRELSGPIGALVWHDLSRKSGVIRYTLILGVIPGVILASLFLPLHVATVVCVLILFMYLAGIAAFGSGAGGASDVKSTLPTYIAASPLSTATIAWTKLLTVAVISLAVFLSVVFVFVGWSLWPENRDVWYRWASAQATSLDVPDSAVSIGIRWSIAIVLGTTVLFVGRMVSFLWVELIGRSWVTGVAAIVMGLAVLVPLGVFLRWFMLQTSWEGTIASAYRYLTYLPSIIAGLLIVKAISAAMATVTLSRLRLTTHKRIVIVYLIWISATLAIATTLAFLVPDRRVTFTWCLVATMLAIPLARVLILPVSLNLNRHR